MKKTIFLLIVILIFTSCQKNKNYKIKSESISQQQNNNDIDTTTIDTFLIENGRKVIFFSPSATEKERLTTIYGQNDYWDFQQLFSNFYNFYHRSSAALTKHHIKNILSHSKIFKIKVGKEYQILDLRKNNQIMGFILYDSSKYKVNYGVYNNKDFITEIRKFYGIKFSF